MGIIKKLFGDQTAPIEPQNHALTGMYSILDTKAGTYSVPFFQPTNTHALRLFKAEVNRDDPTNTLSLYPEDFELHMVGTFNPINGELIHHNSLIATGRSLKKGE